MLDKEHNILKFRVNVHSTNFFKRALIVRGYIVQGRVLAENEPLDGVQVMIYSFNSTLV